MAKTEQATTDAFEDLDSPVASPAPKKRRAPAKKAEPKSTSTKVNFEFPEGTDSKVINAVMAQVGKMTEQQVKAREGVSAGRAKYVEECKKRYRCVVNSLRPGWDHFELTISNPKTDAPITVRGRCGVILEEGLTKFAIDCLKRAHDFRVEKGASMTIEQILAVDTAMVVSTKSVRQPHYSVDILGEVTNPKPVGTKIGRY
jgi:hypothetical protein